MHNRLKYTVYHPIFSNNTFLTIQDCSIVQIQELNKKIDFLIKASKLGIPLDTKIVLALPRLCTPNILQYTLL